MSSMSPRALTWHRAVLWTVLILFAIWFLTPLYVMIVTSLKDMDQIRGGSLLSLPTSAIEGGFSRPVLVAAIGGFGAHVLTFAAEQNLLEKTKILPLYLPGNGGLLYAVAMMAAGWDGAPDGTAPGFPADGSWTVRHEGLTRCP